MSNFYIKKVRIKNFRGYKNQEFEFFKNRPGKQGLILLGGPNGYGKTSFLDSLEWCFTGTIKRLEKEYKLRQEDTLKMQKGILKHNGTKEDTVVTIEAEYNNKEVIMTRTFTDKSEFKGFLIGNSPFVVNIDGEQLENAKTIDDVLGITIAKTFYERHISSYEKNIRIYEKGRNDFVEMFAQFFGGTDELDILIKNLEGYEEKSGKKKVIVPGIINEFEQEIKSKRETQKINVDELNIENENLKGLFDKQKNVSGLNTRLNDYPETLTYPNEYRANYLYNLSDSEARNTLLIKQISNFEKLKDIVEKKSIYEWIKEYIGYLSDRIKLDMFREHVLYPFIKNETEIIKIKSINLRSLQNNVNDYNEKINKIKKLNIVNKNNIKSLEEEIESLENFETKYKKELEDLFSLLKRKETLNESLKLYKTENKAIQSLRIIIDHIDGFQELRDSGHENCPLCGSHDFSEETVEIAKIARETIGIHESEREIIQREYTEIKQDLHSRYNSLIEELLILLDSKKSETQNNIDTYNSYKSFFNILSQYNLDFEKITYHRLLAFETNLREKLVTQPTFDALERRIIDNLVNQHSLLEGLPSKIVKNSEMSLEEYMVMDYSEKRKTLTSYVNIYDEKLNTLDFINTEMVLENRIDEGTIRLKIDILKDIQSFLAQHDNIHQLTEYVQKLKGKVESGNLELEALKNQLDYLKNTLRELKILQTKYNIEIVQQINGPLKKIFKRLNRHTNIETINLISEGKVNHKVSLSASLDEKSEIFVPNILSAGQLSIVSLSIFLTIAMGQKNLPFRCYFMDDPIQTMDDLNILSFVDLLRTELKSDENDTGLFDQIFLTTCDENLEKLIQHKMKTFGVNLTHMHFSNYGEYKIEI